jgi:hypothetical protein
MESLGDQVIRIRKVEMIEPVELSRRVREPKNIRPLGGRRMHPPNKRKAKKIARPGMAE